MKGGDLTQRSRLSTKLRRLRCQAGLSTRALATQLGWSQNKISKLEGGQVTPKIADVEAWGHITGAPPDEIALLLEMAKQARSEALILRGKNLADLQREAGKLERTAMVIRVYVPTLIPGLLQTRAYIEAIFTSGHLPVSLTEEGLLARLERQAILFDESKKFEFIIGEAALSWRFGPPAAHLAQLERLRVMAGLSNVDLGILPIGFSGSAWWHHEINLYEEFSDGTPPYVEIETLSSIIPVSNPEEVDRYILIMAELRKAALFNQDALDPLTRIAAKVQALPS